MSRACAAVILSEAKNLRRAAPREHYMKRYYVYIMTNHSRTLYTGVTNDIARRVYEHRQKLILGFTTKYNISRLVYYEETSDVRAAIERERQIKGWTRERKLALIEAHNPGWLDLSEDLVPSDADPSLRSG